MKKKLGFLQQINVVNMGLHSIVLQGEGYIWLDGCITVKKIKEAGRRKSKINAHVCRFELRTLGAEGYRLKKVIAIDERREMANKAILKHKLSE